MVLSAMKRRTSFIMVCVLLMMLLPLNSLSGTAFAQATRLQRTNCSKSFLIEPVSCLSAPIKASLGKTLFSHKQNQPLGRKTQTASALTVQQVGLADITGNGQATFVPGETVIYAALINNTSSSAITATINFMVQASINECKFNLTGTGLSIPTGQSTWEAISDLCGDEWAGTYTFKATVTDQSTPSDTSYNSGPFTVNADNIGFPSLWNGQLCDTNQYASSRQLGTANYRGIPACGPRPLYDPSAKHPIGDVGSEQFVSSDNTAELEWECPELSIRLMYQVYGIQPYVANGDQVVDNYLSNVSNNILVPVQNGSGSLPVPGDILSYTTNHTSVVLSRAIDGSTGNGSIYVIEENGARKGIATLSVQGGTISGVKNWLHHTLDLWPQTASPGSTVLVSAEGFQPNEAINFYFDVFLYHVTADSNGQFAGTLTVPQVQSGTHIISVIGATTRPVTQTLFYVP